MGSQYPSDDVNTTALTQPQQAAVRVMFWNAKPSPEPNFNVKPEEILKTFVKVSQGRDQV